MADSGAAAASKKKLGGGKKGAAECETHPCFHCHSDGAKMCCSQCTRAWYCGKACQKKHWKQHKKSCTAAVAAEARRATLKREATMARAGGTLDKETCVICVGPVVAPVELPCGHAYCGGCLAELRTKKVAQACPLCREALPPGVEGLWDLAFRVFLRVDRMDMRGEVTWESLPAAEQLEMNEAEAMLREAGAQGHVMSKHILGYILELMRNDHRGAEAAYRAVIAAEPRYCGAHFALGHLLYHKRQDIDGAEAAYRAAIAAEPGYARAHFSLGVLLQKQRNDIDGAEAAYRAAIAAEPGYARAHFSLGVLLQKQRNDPDGAEVALRAAIAAAEAPRNNGRGQASTAVALGNAHGALAVILFTKRNDFDGAEAELRAAIALDPTNASFHRLLALMPQLREAARRQTPLIDRLR